MGQTANVAHKDNVVRRACQDCVTRVATSRRVRMRFQKPAPTHWPRATSRQSLPEGDPDRLQDMVMGMLP
jgi:hypothetical protein